MNKIRFAIIGAGFGGIGMGISLLARGERDFLIFDRSEGVGGTWWLNRYPGCACDVPSHLYSFSFFPNPDWSRRFAPRAEIQAYLERATRRFKLTPHLRLGTGISSLAWNESESAWSLRDQHGQSWQARYVVSAIGGLSRPKFPEIPGLSEFSGDRMHSQQWDDAIPLSGRRVAVIGTGASAAQLVPEIAPKVARLDVYQRKPHWVLPRPDAVISAHRRAWYRRMPALQKLARFGIWLISESRVPGLTWSTRLAAFHRALARRHLKRQVPDPALRARLKPDFDIGCKRVILSSDWYPSLTRPNVALIDDPIDRIESNAIVTRDGYRRQTDIVVLATGFRATDPVPAGLIRGRDGRDLHRVWRAGPQAWRGVAVHGFPNLFMLLGPNTALGHNSVILMIEAQIEFISRTIANAADQGCAKLEVRAEAQQRYNEWLQRKLQGTVWNTGGCSSWYLHPESGLNTTLWPASTWRYQRMMHRADERELDF